MTKQHSSITDTREVARPGTISVVIPVFGSTGVLSELVERTSDTLSNIAQQHEIILVEDGGPASNWDHIGQIAMHHKEVRGVRLSRNFGQQEAIAAGVAESAGDIVIVMDCDLQDPPECIPRLLQAIDVGRRHRHRNPGSRTCWNAPKHSQSPVLLVAF